MQYGSNYLNVLFCLLLSQNSSNNAYRITVVMSDRMISDTIIITCLIG